MTDEPIANIKHIGIVQTLLATAAFKKKLKTLTAKVMRNYDSITDAKASLAYMNNFETTEQAFSSTSSDDNYAVAVPRSISRATLMEMANAMTTE